MEVGNHLKGSNDYGKEVVELALKPATDISSAYLKSEKKVLESFNLLR